ncbi:hypothetical protein F652_3147 [Enterobacteriaceae bacterium bta3-1]|nr:hypothetical protein F652_3147 [Enterobacteriaceae bacterium bta3-1]
MQKKMFILASERSASSRQAHRSGRNIRYRRLIDKRDKIPLG